MKEEILNGLKSKNNKHIAKAISIIENDTKNSNLLLEQISKKTNHSIRIGITGPPGAGKSTITNKLIQKFRKKNKSVAALLVDPTSPFSKGALLGDRIRIQDNYNDKNIYVRSIASRGFKGGLADNIDNIAEVLEYAGFDIIIFETVGVGQIELDVVESVDTVIVVLVPESGDDIQMMKAGLIEIADIYTINKSDRKDSDKLYLILKNILDLSNNEWLPDIIKTVATDGIGISELYDKIYNHREYLLKTEIIFKKYNQRYIKKIKDKLIQDFEDSFWNSERLKILDLEVEKDTNKRKSTKEIINKLKSLS